MSASIEKAFDTGIIVIVPDIPDHGTKNVLCDWVNDEVRGFKVLRAGRHHGFQEFTRRDGQGLSYE